MSDVATRLIVKELPKTADEKSVISHLTKLCGDAVIKELTDCRVIRHGGKSRRIAFIGFKTPASASICQKASDKTFINTSRISVMHALKEGDAAIPREWSRITKNKNSREQSEQNATAADEAETIAKLNDTGRLLILNTPYETNVEDVKKLCEPFGKVVDVKIPPQNRGMIYVTFAFPPSAVQAYTEINNSIFMGRKIRCKASDECHDHDPIEKVCGSHSLKSQAKMDILEKKLKRTADSRNWNLLYVSASVATDVMAKYLGVEAEDIVDTENVSDSIAARVAIAESYVIAETKKWLATLGLPEEVFERYGNTLLSAKIRQVDGQQGEQSSAAFFSKQTFFVKHLGPWVADGEELKKLLGRYGKITYFGLAPTKTIAIVSYSAASEAARTFAELALYNFHSRPLYLEYAPALVDAKLRESGLLNAPHIDAIAPGVQAGTDSQTEDMKTSTIYITNVSFDTTEDQLTAIFGKYPGLRKVSLLKSRKRVRDLSTGASSDLVVSLGHGFVVYDTVEHAAAALKENLDLVVDGHAIKMEWSRSKESAAQIAKRPRTDEEPMDAVVSRKLIVKNLDFTANAKDLKQLFQTYGTVTSCRLPKRSDGRIRGFAFIEFATIGDASQALKSLTDVRLFGRRLIIQPAAAGEE